MCLDLGPLGGAPGPPEGSNIVSYERQSMLGLNLFLQPCFPLIVELKQLEIRRAGIPECPCFPHAPLQHLLSCVFGFFFPPKI